LPDAALVSAVPLSLILGFLLVAYLRGGKDDLKAAAEAVHKVRQVVGVAAVLGAMIEALRARR